MLTNPSYLLNQISTAIENQKRDYQVLSEAHNRMMKSFYDLRNKIEQKRKQKVDDKVILDEILGDLIKLTPHGKDNVVS